MSDNKTNPYRWAAAGGVATFIAVFINMYPDLANDASSEQYVALVAQSIVGAIFSGLIGRLRRYYQDRP